MIDLEENRRELDRLNERFLSLENTIGKQEKLESKLKELEEKTLVDGFWNDTKTSNTILREIKDTKSKLNSIISIGEEINNLIETNDFLKTESDKEMEDGLAKSTNNLSKKIENLETKMFLSGKYDINNAIITLHPGARRNWITGLGSNAI